MLREAIKLCRSLADVQSIAIALQSLGAVMLGGGHVRAAEARYREALELCVRLGSVIGIVDTVEGIAEVRWHQGRAGPAVRLYGAVAEMRRAGAVRLRPHDQTRMDQVLCDIRASMGERSFAREFHAGSQLSMRQAIAETFQRGPPDRVC